MKNNSKEQPQQRESIISFLKNSELRAYSAKKDQIVQKLKQQPLWWIDNKKYLLDTKQGLIWNADPRQATEFKEEELTVKAYSHYPILGKSSEIPLVTELQNFAQIVNNPLRDGQPFHLWKKENWKAVENNQVYRISLFETEFNSRAKQVKKTKKTVTETGGGVSWFGHYTQTKEIEVFTHYPTIWVNRHLAKDLNTFIDYCLANKISISSLEQPEQNILNGINYTDKNSVNPLELLKKIDFNRCRLPKIDERYFSDLHLGLWEYWDEPSAEKSNIVARNPALDIQSGNIGIDFGTSSTVVAYEDKNGNARLLRIGVKDFYEDVKSEHYENPTVLEFIDFNRFQKEWHALVYQPLVNWNDVRCAHEAQENFRDNGSNPKVVSSILPKIKQWALREADDTNVCLTDQAHGFTHRLAHLQLKRPVKGQRMQVNEDYDFDPVELYAWFLGLNINWRERGIFLKYYMTFPVAYPREVKDKILASFERGLLRSLPESLVSNSEVMNNFRVEERASEPAAYAVAALEALGIEPPDDDKGLAYAVFDFGGGTADFDYGYYRFATEQEEQSGFDYVFEHFEPAGDKFLGGENLLENLAYLVFKQNLDICRKNHITFTRPLDAEPFAGSEMLIGKMQAAYTNTLMLMSVLRDYWQSGKLNVNSSGIASINLVNREGETKKCDLALPKDQMDSYLEERIAQGIQRFLIGLKKAFGNEQPSKIHVLLAGNSSRSKLVTEAFGIELEKAENPERAKRTQAFLSDLYKGGNKPELVVHKPLEADQFDESIPTAKTGVALGILRLCPGSAVKVINRTVTTDEAPFAHYVGKVRRKLFQIGLKRNSPYQVWTELGVVTEDNAFNLFHTQSELALHELKEGHSELYRKSFNFVGSAGQKVFARAISPDVIEICTAETLEQAGSHNLREVNLAK